MGCCCSKEKKAQKAAEQQALGSSGVGYHYGAPSNNEQQPLILPQDSTPLTEEAAKCPHMQKKLEAGTEGKCPYMHKKEARIESGTKPEGVTMAQTYCKGPLKAQGSGRPVTEAELAACKVELEKLVAEGHLEPVRSFMDKDGVAWRFGGPPDYTLANLAFLKGRTKAHAKDSLELIVENLVKTWEMERSHKLDCDQHRSVDPKTFHIGANGWKKYDNTEANRVGNYNVLMSGVRPELWDAENMSWEDSHQRFHEAFASFPWELLEVFSGPPKVAFSWRHWAHWTGKYEGRQGDGELVELFGFAVATVNDKLELVDVEVYYKPEEFLEVMKGTRPVSDLAKAKSVMGSMCPYLARKK